MDNTEIRKQIHASFKLFYGFLPGAHIIDMLAEFKSNLIQERLNNFTSSLELELNHLAEKGKTYKVETLKTSHFTDTVDYIVKQIILTDNESKIRHYKNVLIRQMFEPDPDRMFLKYLSMINKIDETQIEIIHQISKHEQIKIQATQAYIALQTMEEFKEKFSNAESEFGNMEKATEVINEWSKKFFFKDTSISEVNFYLKELESFALIVDVTPTGIQLDINHNLIPRVPFYQLTGVGASFIDFINEYGD